MHLQEDCIIGFSYRRELKLDARAKYPDCSLADLYDELTMPVELRKAHQGNDKAVLSPLFLRFRTDNERTSNGGVVFRDKRNIPGIAGDAALCMSICWIWFIGENQ